MNSISTTRNLALDPWTILCVQIFGTNQSEPSAEEASAENNIKKFSSVPLYLESLLFFGYFVCLDAFLYTVTFLPIRAFMSLLLLLAEGIRHASGGTISWSVPKAMGFHRHNTYDIMRGLLLVFGSLVLCTIDMSYTYHLIRGQTLIKLYVMTGMLEIFDKLLGSFGQDAFASLNLQTRSRPHDLFTTIGTFLIVCLYVALHSILYFVHTATLSVALNSANKSFVTLIVLNNFAEIKSFVFKKFEKQNLFQLACADITERFNITLFIALIVPASESEGDAPWSAGDWWALGVMVGTMLAGPSKCALLFGRIICRALDLFPFYLCSDLFMTYVI